MTEPLGAAATAPRSVRASAEAAWRFPRTPRSVPLARAVLRTQLAAWETDARTVDTACLVLSELMTNAQVHARVPPGREIGVRFARQPGCLRIEVADASTEPPEPRDARGEDEHGRGLALVIALAENWGACPRRHGIGKVVWAEIATSAGAERADPDEV
ncbi:ATP-binding protein [Streptomyces sp. bgisy100]|uniref:ATP-binding protein n=1 Tax=Streptomyces sp. bgisy100 TaxID=3413783 RepID=UPI003D741A14